MERSEKYGLRFTSIATASVYLGFNCNSDINSLLFDMFECYVSEEPQIVGPYGKPIIALSDNRGQDFKIFFSFLGTQN